MKNIIKKIYAAVLFYFFKYIPLQDKVVFSTFSGKRYGDNPKIISQMLYEKYPTIKQVWLLKKKNNEIPKYVEQVKWGSILMIFHLATSKVWVDSHTKPEWVKKRKGQYYINTWHGGLGIKKIEGDAEEKLAKCEVARIKNNSSMVDVFISNSDWLTKIYKRAFWYEGKIEKFGYPKDDYLLKTNLEEIRKKVFDFFGFDEKTKVLLYAPTMRNNPKAEIFDIGSQELLETLENKYGCKWKILIRLHPVNEKEISKIKFDENIIDATSYSDILELIEASEILLTDYSSCIFDATLISKKALIYAPDEEEYKKERGLYINIDELPFLVARTKEELNDNIKEFDYDVFLRKVKRYYDLVGFVADGYATERIVKLIINRIEG